MRERRAHEFFHFNDLRDRTCGNPCLTEPSPALPVRAGIDAVYVATPPSFHREQTIACACSRKHVLYEKSPATTVEDAEAMIAACSKANGSWPPVTNRHAPVAPSNSISHHISQPPAAGTKVEAAGVASPKMQSNPSPLEYPVYPEN
ncbi:MAG: Gfo/Idh/MocA family oxidoreductase [Verrucomicrobia bacterium]|nr:Gfo/Idh/MocA family oxidoreductase [Verrucomicrobiota bacterium]